MLQMMEYAKQMMKVLVCEKSMQKNNMTNVVTFLIASFYQAFKTGVPPLFFLNTSFLGHLSYFLGHKCHLNL